MRRSWAIELAMPAAAGAGVAEMATSCVVGPGGSAVAPLPPQDEALEAPVAAKRTRTVTLFTASKKIKQSVWRWRVPIEQSKICASIC